MSRRLLLLAAIAAGSCTLPQDAANLPHPTRGVLVLSLSGLSTEAITATTTPFLWQLAEKGISYDWAVAPSSSTLASQVALVTGLHPGESGIDHILLRPSAQLESLGERFGRFGFVTGGFTEGGFVSETWGFGRGFDHFSDPTTRAPEATRGTLARALDFIESLPSGQRFLVFVHSAALEPPWGEEESFAAIRQGRIDPTPEAIAEQRAAYTRALGRLDAALRAAFEEIEGRGLLGETTVAIVGDHGEEIFDHGRLGHDQLYPEVTRVPLILIHPDLSPRKVHRLVRTADLLPTLSLVAGLPPHPGSLAPTLPTPLAALLDPPPTLAWAESFGAVLQRSVWLDDASEGPFQLIETRVEPERDGSWVSRRTAFDAEVGAERALAIRLVSFAEERLLRVRVDSQWREDLLVPRRWRTVTLALEEGRHRIELETDGCTVPAEIDLGADPRCLSFKVQGPPLRRVEVFDLRNDPTAVRDLSAERPELRERMEALLGTVPAGPPVAWPERLQRTPEIKRFLSSLGYLDWGG